MIKVKLTVSNISKERIFKGEKGSYLDVVLIEKPDKYGNEGFVAEDVSKEERESGVKGNIIGSWKHVGQSKPSKQTAPKPPSRPAPNRQDDEDDDIPFN